MNPITRVLRSAWTREKALSSPRIVIMQWGKRAYPQRCSCSSTGTSQTRGQGCTNYCPLTPNAHTHTHTPYNTTQDLFFFLQRFVVRFNRSDSDKSAAPHLAPSCGSEFVLRKMLRVRVLQQCEEKEMRSDEIR